ncbi:MAG: sialidase family protein [Ginsengibacter sp.]
MKKIISSFISLFIFLVAFTQQKNNNDITIAKGNMPAITKDKKNNISIVYGTGDSIMYMSSNDARSYSSPALVAVLPGLVASATRGPQVAAASNGLIVTACNKKGNIFSFKKDRLGKWTKAKKVNDVNENAKEGLMDLSTDGLNTFAIWLGVNNPKGQKVYGAKSTDGGITWSKNIIVYASPDGSVCECCKPSVSVKGNNVYVMFRNWLNGNRDLYLIKSSDGGKSFGQAQKLGNGSWKLNGCPMDGGDLAINSSGIPETVWRREGKIFAAIPGSHEMEVGEGRSCSIETINNENIYAWTEKGKVIVMKPGGIKINLGDGSLPLLKALNNEKVICVWENENMIHTAVVTL